MKMHINTSTHTLPTNWNENIVRGKRKKKCYKTNNSNSEYIKDKNDERNGEKPIAVHIYDLEQMSGTSLSVKV